MTVPFCLITFTSLASLVMLGSVCAQVPGGGTTTAVSSVDSSQVPELPVSPTWIGWGSFSSGIGMRDNLLLSHAGEERRGFVRGGIDATAWHVPQGRVDYLAVINATGTRYFATTTVNHEEQVIALASWRYRVRDVFKFSMDSSGSYSHLIYDVSDTDVRQVVTEVKRSAAGFGPTMRWGFLPTWWIEAQTAVRREIYPDGFNNRGIRERTARLGWHPGKRFEASVAALEWRRHYDTREQYSVSGRELAGTSLVIRERAGEARLKMTLDKAEHWKTDTRVGVGRFSDNGSGYLDYRERRVSQEIECSAGQWLCSLEGSARRVEFEVQTIGFGLTPPARVRDAYLGRLHVERKLTARWTAYADYTWERNRCNDPIASYLLNEGLLGVRWNWEK